MSQKGIQQEIEELEERIEIQILTLQIIRESLMDLYKRVGHLKEDLP